MALDDRYVTAVDLCEYFVDKTTGAPLAGGQVFFYEDENRTTPKLVYQYDSTSSPNYEPMPNPIILSATGTFQDNSGNNVAVYYYPYDADGNLELYYIVVQNSLGQEQFTREAWPNVTANVDNTQANISNAITNPQFANVLFIPSSTLVINMSGAQSKSVTIAPDWILNITSTNTTTVSVTRNSITGLTAYPFNPPYTLTVTPGSSISSLVLSQKLKNNPNIWSPQPGASDGYVGSSILLAPNSTVTMQYAPSTGAVQTLLTANNLSGLYSEFNNTVQLTPPVNSDNADTGYVNINIVLSTTSATTLSNVQVVGLESNIENVVYDQTTVNRQVDQMFNYYNPLLQAKPITSYLVGWDFPLNPAQFLGPTSGPFASGANSSNYVWDQTIVFQSADSGVSISRATAGGLVVSAAATTQLAVIQYLSAAEATRILNNRISCNVAAVASAPVNCKISLWYCTDANLPSCVVSNNSLVATLDSTGKPATLHGTWFEVPRSNLGDAAFTIGTSSTTNYNDYGFSGWDLLGGSGVTSATFFAIVVGTASIPMNGNITFGSISAVPGDIPTRPAPLTSAEVTMQCQQYFEKSFKTSTVPASNVGVKTGESFGFQTFGAATDEQLMGSIFYRVTKIMNPNIIITFNPAAAGGNVRNETINVTCTNVFVDNVTENSFIITYTTAAGSSIGDINGVHWYCDARLGY